MTINHDIFVSFSTVQIYDISYIHLHKFIPYKTAVLDGYYITTVATFITVLSAGLTVMNSSSKRLHVSMETVVFQIPIIAVNVKKNTNSKLTQVDNQLFDNECCAA